MSRLALEVRGRPGVLDLFATLSAAAAGYACVGAACIAVGRFGGFVAQIWLPNALTVLVLSAAPARYRLVIGAGAALGCISADIAFSFALSSSIAFALANTLEIALAYRAVALGRGGIARRGPQRLVLAWFIGALAAPALGALVGAAALQWTAGQSFTGSYRAWLVSDAFALAIVLPWTLRSTAGQAAHEWTPPVLLEFGALLAASLAIGAASVRFLDWPFVAASLLPILAAARLPLGPQMALAGINAFALVAMVNFENMLASPHVVGADPTTLTASSFAAFLPSIFFAFVFDSLRQQAQALASEEARWRSVMQTSPIGMALISPAGAFLEVNGALAQMLGYTSAELLARTVRDLADPQDAQATLAAASEVASGTYEVVRLQKRYRRKDGRPMTAIVALSALRGPDGIAHVLLKQVEDITGRLEDARVLAEALERERADARFRAAVEVAPTAMLIIDRRGDITMVNAQVERAFGWRREELIGRSIEALIPARFRTAHLTHRLAFLGAPQTRQMGEGRELYALRKDGSEFPVEVGLASFETGDRSFVLAAVVDITQRKRGESDILRANADLEEFAYIVSHDLRTPLRGIDNLVDWISDDLGAHPPGDVARNLERMRLRVHRMENMIQDLFTYSRVGRADVAHELIDPEALVQHLVEDLAIPDALRVQVRNSAGLLRAARTPVATVLRNLLANAVKHHDLAAGNVVVEVSRDGRFYVIVLTDDGPGIAAEDQGRIFKLFQTLAPVQGEHTGGIGLAVVKKWVEASGGSVQVASPVEAGRGSRFTVRWPVNGEQVATTSHQG